MASRGDRPDPAGSPRGRGGWPESEPGPIADPLNDPVGAYATQAMPAAERPVPERRKTAVRRRVATRRVKRTVKHIDPMTVLKVSGFFYVVFLVAWLIFAAILYAVVASTGVFDTIESISEGFALDFKVQINLWFVERWAFLIGFVIAVCGLLLNTAAAFLYNVAADTIGGIEVTFVERDT